MIHCFSVSFLKMNEESVFHSVVSVQFEDVTSGSGKTIDQLIVKTIGRLINNENTH